MIVLNSLLSTSNCVTCVLSVQHTQPSNNHVLTQTGISLRQTGEGSNLEMTIPACLNSCELVSATCLRRVSMCSRRFNSTGCQLIASLFIFLYKSKVTKQLCPMTYS